MKKTKDKSFKKKIVPLPTLLSQLNADFQGNLIQKRQAFDVLFRLFCDVTRHQAFDEKKGSVVVFLRQCFDASRHFLELLPDLNLDEHVQKKYYEHISAIQSKYARHCPSTEERAVLEIVESTLVLAGKQHDGETKEPILKNKSTLEVSVEQSDNSCLLPEELLKTNHVTLIGSNYHTLHQILLELRADRHSTLEKWFALKQETLSFILKQEKMDTPIEAKLQQVELALRIVSDYIEFCLHKGLINKIAAPRGSMIKLFQRYANYYAQTDAPEATKQALKEKADDLQDYAFKNIEINFYKGLMASSCVDPNEKKGARRKRDTLIKQSEHSIASMLETYYDLMMRPIDALEHQSIDTRIRFLKHQKVVLRTDCEDSISKLHLIASRSLQDAFFHYCQVPPNRCIGLIDPPIFLVNNAHDWYDDTSQIVETLNNDLSDLEKETIGEVIQLYFHYKRLHVTKEMKDWAQTYFVCSNQLESDLFIMQTRQEMYQFLFQKENVIKDNATKKAEGIENACRWILSSLYATAYMKKLALNTLQNLDRFTTEGKNASECVQEPEEPAAPSVLFKDSVTPKKSKKSKKNKKGTMKPVKDADEVWFNLSKDYEFMKLSPPDWEEYQDRFNCATQDDNDEEVLRVVDHWIKQVELDFTGDPNLYSRMLFDMHLDKVTALQWLERYSEANDCLDKMGMLYLIDPSFKKIRLQQSLILLCRRADLYADQDQADTAIRTLEEAEQMAEANDTFCFEASWHLKMSTGQFQYDFLERLCTYLLEEKTFILLHDRQWEYFYFCYEKITTIIGNQLLKKQSNPDDMLDMKAAPASNPDSSFAWISRETSSKIYALLLRYSEEFFPNLLFDIYKSQGMNFTSFYLSSWQGMDRKKAQEAFSKALQYTQEQEERHAIQHQIDVLASRDFSKDMQNHIENISRSRKKEAFFSALKDLLTDGMPVQNEASTPSQLISAIEEYAFFFEIRNVLLLLEKIPDKKQPFQFKVSSVIDEIMLVVLIDLMKEIKTHEASLNHCRFLKKDLSADEKTVCMKEWWWTAKYVFETMLETANIFSLIFDEDVDSEIQKEIEQERHKKQNIIESIARKIEPQHFTALPTKIDLTFKTAEKSVFSLPSMPEAYDRGLNALIQNKPSYALHYLLDARQSDISKQKSAIASVPIAYCSIWLLKALHSDEFQRHIEASLLKEHFGPLYQCIHSYTKYLSSKKNMCLFDDTIKRSIAPAISQLPEQLTILEKSEDESQKDSRLSH
jgi:hypothetical protein